MKLQKMRILIAVTILLPPRTEGKVFLRQTILSNLSNDYYWAGIHKSPRNTKKKYLRQPLCVGLRVRGGSDYYQNDEERYYDYRQHDGDRRSSGRGDNKNDYSSQYSGYYDGRDERGDHGEDKFGYDIKDDREEAANDDYNDKDSNVRSRPSRKTSRQFGDRTSSFLPKNLPGIPLPNRKVGVMMIGSGSAITILGVSLFFNKTLLRLGNVLFLLGVPLTIGVGRTMGYFLQPKKARATACLSCGMLLVLIGWPVLGIAMEFFGLLNLFGNMFPLLMMMARRIPFVGDILPDGSKQKKKKASKSKYSRDEYDGDRDYYGDEEEKKNAEKYY